MSAAAGNNNTLRKSRETDGNSEEFSLENMAFNHVCFLSFILLAICLCINLAIGLYLMGLIVTILMANLCVMYYFSRYKKQYKAGIVVYVVLGYVALILNFLFNDGTSGPTLWMFFIPLIFLISISRHRLRWLWVAIHLFVVLSLIGLEYFYPALITQSYLSRADRFLDIVSATIVTVIFVYSLTNYLRNYYNKKWLLADERALAISVKNSQITLQNQQLEKVNDEKNKLFSIVSHDLKAPLDSITGYLELLSNNLLDESETQTIQEELLDQTRYTTDLLQNLMSWAKAQMHGVVVHLCPLNLKALVEEVAGNKTPVAARKGIKLTYSIQPAIEIVADRDMMHIVLRNLINNAIKFTNSGGEVSIKATVKGTKAIISVRDTGIGISEEKQSEIFTLKTQSTYGTQKEKGIGLGLMMCKEFMDYQQGDIWFKSKAGEGTEFFISLALTKL